MNATFTIPVKKGEIVPINSFRWVAVKVRRNKKSWKVELKKKGNYPLVTLKEGAWLGK